MLLSPALARQTKRAGDEVAVGHRRAVGRQSQGVAGVFDEAANHAQHIFLALMRAGKRIVAGLVPADVVRHQAGKGVHAAGREGVEAGGDGVLLGRVSMGCSYEMAGRRILRAVYNLDLPSPQGEIRSGRVPCVGCVAA